MPSPFDALFSDARNVLVGGHGQAVTWTPATGDAIATTAILGVEELREIQTENGVGLHRVRSADLLAADVPDPNRGGTLTIDGVIWAFQSVDGRDGGFVYVTVVRPEQAEITQRGYRGRE